MNPARLLEDLYTPLSPDEPLIRGPDPPIVPPELRKCEWCSKSSRELRRCAACNSALYCNRECQKAAWKRHKTTCKAIATCVTGKPNEDAVLTELRAIGFSTMAEFSEALADFREAHGWALACIAKAAARREGSPEWLTPTKALCIHLSPRSAAERRTHRDPGSAFWIKKLNFSSSDSVDELREFRSGLSFATQNEHAEDPDYIGALLVVYFIEGFRVTMSVTYAQFRPMVLDLPSPEEQGAIFDDLSMLCVGCINMGCPLRVLEGNDPIVALPGRFSRVQGKWTWKPLFDDWKEYRGGDAGLDGVLGRLRLPDVSPAQLMSAMSRL
ncbi:hypothetical protein OH76DRAFT_1344360 [Lentinus brumalis]|uniref:MYND-type domain-containing protein n=1 Tax=Lentinus brumalis TaxID=2498619 RepID=A0A371DK10_9APHY|nr:hypothetical protein OH76DRAFT_1344360 [Polyporus brumalis]